MISKMSHKVVLVVTIPLLFQITFFCFLLHTIKELDEMQSSQRKTETLFVLRDQLHVWMAKEGYYLTTYRATKEPEYYKGLQQTSAQLDAIYRKMLEELKNDNVKSHIIKAAHRDYRATQQYFKFLIGDAKPTTFSELAGGPMVVERLKTTLFQMKRSTNPGNLGLLFGELKRSQASLFDRFKAKEAELNRMLFLGAIASVLVSAVTGLLFSASIVRRLQTVASNIRSLENREDALLEVSGADEIAVLNHAVRETGEKIKQAEEFQAQTARIVAQELQQPIDNLSQSLTELQEQGFEKITDDGKQRLERSLLEVQRLRTLTRDLLSLDKISRAGWDLEITLVNLSEIAAIAVDTVKDFAASVAISIKCDLTDVRVFGDPSRLQQIALNLLTNAIKFSKRRTTIEVETKIEGNFGKLSVTDHGTGIPEEFQQSIFGKFEQASREDSTEKGGSGLGLAISKKLIESQQGRMGFRSKLGEGSTFWVMLPCESRSTEASAEVSNSSEPSGGTISEAPNHKAPNHKKEELQVRPSLWLNGLLLVLLPTVLQLATLAFLYVVIHQITANSVEFNRSSKIASYHASVVDTIGEASQMAILYNIDHEDRIKSLALDSQRKIADLLYELHNITKGDKELEENANHLERLAKRTLKFDDEIINAPQDADLDVWFSSGKLEEMLRINNEIVLPIQNAIDQENRLIDNNIFAKAETRRAIEFVIFALAIGTFLFAVAFGIFLTRKLASRVDHIVQNTKRLADKEPLLSPLPGDDEIAYVDRSFFEAGNRLIQLERFKQEIIAITSHEFRTPLTSLLAKVDLIQVGVFGPLNEKGQQIAIGARSTIVFLIVLITNLLDVEKIQSGKTIVAKDLVCLDSIFGKIVQNVAELCDEHQVTINASSKELTANADEVRLVQSLTAALTDIIEHAPPQSTIHLIAKMREDKIEISISAPGGNCSRESLNSESARGRLASDLLRLVAEQHGGTSAIDASEGQLLVKVKLPAV